MKKSLKKERANGLFFRLHNGPQAHFLRLSRKKFRLKWLETLHTKTYINFFYFPKECQRKKPTKAKQKKRNLPLER